MHRKALILSACLSVIMHASTASAGAYADDLGKCLVAASGNNGQTLLVQWIFTIMTLNPSVAPYSAVTDAQRQDINKRAGALYGKLLTQDCRKETVASLKYEGVSSFESAFGTLGQVAMRGLMSGPAVAAGMEKLGDGMDENAMADLAKEAGIAMSPSPPAP